MNIQAYTIKLFKYFYSVLLVVIAYHYFIEGTTSISTTSIIELESKRIEDFLSSEPKDTEKKPSTTSSDPDVITDNKDAKIESPSIVLLNRDPKIAIYSKIDSIKVKKNETLSIILINQDIPSPIRQEIINATSEIFNLKKLNIGQKIDFHYKKDSNENVLLNKIEIPLSYKHKISIKKIKEKYVAEKISLPINLEKRVHRTKIKTSLYEAGLRINIPRSVLIDLIRMYSFDIDFQRDIRVDDEFTVFYEVILNEEKREVAYGDILYSNIILQGKELEYYLFKSSDNKEYFNKDGKNIRKAIMKTPLDGARLSSGFGMRKHPILGYNLKHQGLDFAAPKGTPVYAAGNGVIEYAGRNGAYGKYIRIRHNNSYKTAYAHLNGFKKGIGAGIRVNQGDIVAYVGSTGRSTGSHLHYEVLLNNERINPMKMNLPSGKALAGDELNQFKTNSNTIYSEMVNIFQNTIN